MDGRQGASAGAALAYYTVFSLAPLLLITIAVAGLIFGTQSAEGRIVDQIRGLVGEKGGEAIQDMIANAHTSGSGILATVAGVAMLLFGAMGLFGQLQDTLDTIWEVEPKSGRGILGFLKDRLLSFTMVMGTAFLLLMSLVISAGLAALGGALGDWHTSLIGQAINVIVSLAVIAALFAMIFRFLPDAKIAWRDVWLGAVLTAVLFTIGKVGIGLYLGHSSGASSYGAAGSLAVLFIWMYYSAQIFLFGAELTKAYANRFGSRIVPDENAVPVTEEARREQGIPRRDQRTRGAEKEARTSADQRR